MRAAKLTVTKGGHLVEVAEQKTGPRVGDYLERKVCFLTGILTFPKY